MSKSYRHLADSESPRTRDSHRKLGWIHAFTQKAEGADSFPKSTFVSVRRIMHFHPASVLVVEEIQDRPLRVMALGDRSECTSPSLMGFFFKTQLPKGNTQMLLNVISQKIRPSTGTTKAHVKSKLKKTCSFKWTELTSLFSPCMPAAI